MPPRALIQEITFPRFTQEEAWFTILGLPTRRTIGFDDALKVRLIETPRGTQPKLQKQHIGAEPPAVDFVPSARGLYICRRLPVIYGGLMPSIDEAVETREADLPRCGGEAIRIRRKPWEHVLNPGRSGWHKIRCNVCFQVWWDRAADAD
jgi:hypothetical protein